MNDIVPTEMPRPGHRRARDWPPACDLRALAMPRGGRDDRARTPPLPVVRDGPAAPVATIGAQQFDTAYYRRHFASTLHALGRDGEARAQALISLAVQGRLARPIAPVHQRDHCGSSARSASLAFSPVWHGVAAPGLSEIGSIVPIMQHTFQPGDVVQLKSGGRPMTIESVESDGTLNCVWFDGDGKITYGAFSQVAVSKSSNPPLAREPIFRR